MPTTDRPSSVSHTVLRVLAWVVSAAVALYVTVSTFRVGLSFWLFEEISAWVTSALGLDTPFSMPLSIALTALATAVLPYVFWSLLLGRHAWTTAAIAFAFAAISSILMLTLGRDVYFDRITGKSLINYAKLPDGTIATSRTPGYDPTYQTKFQPITPEVAIQLQAQKGKRPSNSDSAIEPAEALPSKAKVIVWNVRTSLILTFDANSDIQITGLDNNGVDMAHCNNSYQPYSTSAEGATPRVVGTGYVINGLRQSEQFKLMTFSSLKPKECRPVRFDFEKKGHRLDDQTQLYFQGPNERKVKLIDIATEPPSYHAR